MTFGAADNEVQFFPIQIAAVAGSISFQVLKTGSSTKSVMLFEVPRNIDYLCVYFA